MHCYNILDSFIGHALVASRKKNHPILKKRPAPTRRKNIVAPVVVKLMENAIDAVLLQQTGGCVSGSKMVVSSLTDGGDVVGSIVGLSINIAAGVWVGGDEDEVVDSLVLSVGALLGDGAVGGAVVAAAEGGVNEH